MGENITNNPSVPTQIVGEVKFTQWVNNLGIIPTSYKDSMSYYETLAWLCKYLEETVIPTVNQNGKATQELQALYIQLNDYVTHYFDDLDIQENVNQKLDEMAEDGTLQEIIGDYLEANALWCFNNVAELKTATNLINGSYAKTLGYYAINDGGMATYKIRTIQNTDIVDDFSIISLSQDNLIAELIIEEKKVNLKACGVYGDNIHDDNVKIQNCIDKFPLYTLYFPKGTYLINNPIIIYQANNYGVNLELDKNAIIKSSASEVLNCLIEIGKDTTKGTYNRRLDNKVVYIKGGIIDCTNVTNGIILNSGRQLTQMSEVNFININQYGLLLEKNNSYTSGDFKISYCNFFRINSSSGVAIKIECYDNELVHIRIDGCEKGIETLGGYQLFEDIHCTALYNDQFTNEQLQKTIAFDFTGGTISITNCYADTYATGWRFNYSGNYMMSNCNTYYYEAFNENIIVKCVDILNDQPKITIMNSRFRTPSNVLKASFINVNRNSYYIQSINNNNIHLYNNIYDNTENKVSFTDLAYCLSLNDKTNMTPYYTGQTFQANKYYYLCSFIISTSTNCPIIRVRNTTQFDSTIKVINNTTINALSSYNNNIRAWTFSMVAGELKQFDNGTTFQTYDLYCSVDTALTNEASVNFSYESYNNPIFSYRKLNPTPIDINSGDILASVTINKTTT